MAENGMRIGAANAAGSSADGDYTNGHNDHDLSTENGKTPTRLNEAAQKYIQDLMSERARMENHFPLAVKLIDEALERVQLNGRLPAREQYADVYQQRTIKLSQKVHVPIKDKKFNYVGKLLGPKGNSLRRLQEETQCKIVILGRFSMKDRAREEELRNSSDIKYAHLNLPLHVEVSTIAAPAEAYARVAYALAEIRRYLIPDKHDDIRQEQFRELMEDPEAAKKITIRQQQQQQQQQQLSNAGVNSNRGSGGGGPYRPKYQPQSQLYHHNEEPVYYRSHNNAFVQQKPYVPAGQRPNPMHSALPPQAIVGASPSGMVLNTVNFSGRGSGMNSGMMTNNALSGGVGSAGGSGAAPNLRYRSSLPYKVIKN
ncbi:KH domain-containing, RNA-binding, signal transduction-associated protein 2 [Teleopsis dalmanni]|uniref:KH domain-containing, RNA-binding, signal transduction-associated protein 2 n=1 Tax=Teleopsis dalmanni TaxID=139649 RepID=UPI0018CE4C4C|nr:KH domain-containing, RNA-binding, signal transduction-associated protein 2 [Teleopsis dalmanni]